MLEFREIPVDSADALTLLEELNQSLISIVGHNGTRHFVPADFMLPGSVFIAGYLDGEPVCCAGIRKQDEKTGEVKRVYARPNAVGAGTKLLETLEDWARTCGYERLVLVCREINVHAIEFYEKLGYAVCTKYGPYVYEADAVCMEKQFDTEAF